MRPTDSIVRPGHVLAATREVRRVGADKLLERMEAREPELASLVLEDAALIARRLDEAGVEPRRARRLVAMAERMALCAALSLQRAYADLWRDVEDGSPPAAPPPNPRGDDGGSAGNEEERP